MPGKPGDHQVRDNVVSARLAQKSLSKRDAVGGWKTNPDMMPKALRILFVEDHRDTRDTMSLLLRRFGHQVDSAETCRSATDLLNSFIFDVLLSDIGLPDGDGCDLVSEAKQKRWLTSIAVTAFTSADDRKRGLDAGFDHYLSKPVDIGQLRSILDQIAA